LELRGMRHHEIHDERTLPLLSKDVVEVDVLLVVRIPHRQTPELFLRGRKFCGPIAGLVNRAEYVEQIREGMKDATRIEVTESEHAAVRTARVVRKNGFQRGMSLRCGAPLFPGEARDPDHPDLAVRPWLLRDPLD